MSCGRRFPTPKMLRQARAQRGWFNWYVSRGLIALQEPQASRDMRRYSHRRKL